MGESAARTCGRSAICGAPNAKIATNQINMIGPNQRPIPAVPWRCTAKSATITPSDIGTMKGWNEGVTTSRPSKALSTDMAGVIRQSP